MNPDLCPQIQSSFSAYLDGAVSGLEMQEIARHLEGYRDPTTKSAVPPCPDCAREFAAWRSTQDALSLLRPSKVPSDLGLKLRLAISREHARRNSRLLDRLSLAWENSLRAIVLQTAAGVAATTFLVGGIMTLLGAVAPANSPVLADDEGLGVITAPHYLYSMVSPAPIATQQDASIIVEAAVDNTGRVYDYRIISGPQDPDVRLQISNQLLGEVFQPASAFGVPVSGRAVVAFSGISVRG